MAQSKQTKTKKANTQTHKQTDKQKTNIKKAIKQNKNAKHCKHVHKRK